jgi:hypothetical protein
MEIADQISNTKRVEKDRTFGLAYPDDLGCRKHPAQLAIFGRGSSE